MTWHLMLTRRSGHKAVRELLTSSRDDIDRLLHARMITDSAMEVEIAKVIQRLVDVERYLHDPSMDWRSAR